VASAPVPDTGNSLREPKSQVLPVSPEDFLGNGDQAHARKSPIPILVPQQSNQVPAATPKPVYQACFVNPNPNARPLNGEEFGSSKATSDGHGELTIRNGNSLDAAVIIENSAPDGNDRLVYVRAGLETTIMSIPPGQHRLKFQIGSDWDKQAEHFGCVSATAIFDRTASYEERETAKGIEYSTVQVTLHKVVDGNAYTTPIDPAAFRRGRRD
jgi:hypothetical protein